MSKLKTVYVPLSGMPVCGHSYPGLIGGDLMIGREEGIYCVERNGVRYIGTKETIPCSKCNAAAEKRFMREVRKLERRKREKEKR